MKGLALKSIYNVLGAISLGNGIWMMVSAAAWFTQMPIGAEDTGPLNAHFVHDVGLVYLLVGIGAFRSARKPGGNLELHLGITLFMAGHALIHVIEILRGDLPASHWLIDFPLVTLPAIVLVGMTPVVLKYKGGGN